MKSLRSKVIHLAHTNPKLRAHLLPILKTATREGKMVGNGWRLTWDLYEFRLEEMPTKGKTKLKVATLSNPYYATKFDAWLPENILNYYGKVQPSDSFDEVKAKIVGAITSEKAMAAVRSDATPGYDPNSALSGLKWYETLVHYLSVVPENLDPFTAEGKDFSVDVSWLEFRSYSPRSDFELADPHYSAIKSSAPTAARKLYQILKADPNALRGISWDEFDTWLKAKKINYKYESSVYR